MISYYQAGDDHHLALRHILSLLAFLFEVFGVVAQGYLLCFQSGHHHADATKTKPLKELNVLSQIQRKLQTTTFLLTTELILHSFF